MFFFVHSYKQYDYFIFNKIHAWAQNKTYSIQGLLIFQDTEAVIWDVIAEKGLHRLSGHKGEVTGVQFITKHNIVVTSSKDTYMRFWDLTTGHCFKTLAGHITEVRFIYE